MLFRSSSTQTTLVCEPAYGVTGRQAAVELRLKNGKVLRREQPEPKGEPGNPLTEEELSDKFTGLVKMVKGAQNLGPSLSETLMNLEKQASVKEIIASLKAQEDTPVLAEA